MKNNKIKSSTNTFAAKNSDARRLVYQVAHDMQSPLAALNIIISSCNELNGETRRILRALAYRIQGITKRLLDDYKKEKGDQTWCDQRQVIGCADFLDQLIVEKKIEYKRYPDIFIKKIASNDKESVIYGDPVQLGRSLSNLINNAVDALFDKTQGRVTISLDFDPTHVMITVQDDGVGMAEADLKRMRQRISFTAGKAQGHGLGMMQVWDMLDDNDGKMVVQSASGQGTKIELTFLKYLYK